MARSVVTDRWHLPRWARPLVPAALILLVQQLLWPISLGTFVSGLVIGVLGSLVALGMALVWRANRIVNISAAELGTLPATLAVLVMERGSSPTPSHSRWGSPPRCCWARWSSS